MLEFLIKDEMVNSSDGIAVGVSGGADSMLLLWALIDKQKEVGFDLEVINVNHHIRGEESDRDSEFVKSFCESKGIPCVVADVDVLKTKKENKLGLEESARNLRYEIFEKEMKNRNLNKLFLAHHKNDQAETILMHIFRGSGISGACGMGESSKIIRPLIKYTKTEILDMCREHGVKFVEDSTNKENNTSRNCIRNIILPEIEKIYPNAVNSIYEFGEKCKEINKYILSKIDENLFVQTKDFLTIKDSAFQNESFIVREYIKIAFEKLSIYSDIEAKHYALIFDLHDAEVNKQINLPHSVVAKRTYEGIKFCKQKRNNINKKEYDFVIGDVLFDGYGKITATFVNPEDVEYGDGSLYADYNKISNKSIWRIRKLGDMFAKLGSGTKKLNDYFTDKKIDTAVRDYLPVLCNENRVLIVAENDISENIKIDGETEQIVKITFNKEWLLDMKSKVIYTKNKEKLCYLEKDLAYSR